MKTNEWIKEIGKKLPYGAKVLISKRTGLTQKTVIDFFKCNHKPHIDTYNSIMHEAISIIKESQNKSNEIKEFFSNDNN